MTSEAVSAVHAVAFLLERLGTWPIGLIVLIVFLGPWVFSFIMSRLQEKRFEAVTQMYKNNVHLVESYAKIAEELHETVRLNSALWSEAIEKINTNQFCPAARVQKKRMEDVG